MTNKRLRVLVACEESQAVTIELRRLGHEAYSCDITDCTGGYPEWHLKQDVTPLLAEPWDMIIAFPPCTYLTNASAVRMRVNCEIVQDRYEKAMKAKEFFMMFYNSDCKRVAIENPVPMKLVGLPPYSQIIQPYYFGDPWKKRTCLWLKGLPLLTPTDVVEPVGYWVGAHGHDKAKKGLIKVFRDPKMRSKTFTGIAKAMAEQWAGRVYD